MTVILSEATTQALLAPEPIYSGSEKAANTGVPSKSRSFLHQGLEHSLQLEADMLQLQQAFRSKSQNISRNVCKLGRLLGIDQAA